MNEITRTDLDVLRRVGTAVICDVFDNIGLLPMPLANDLWPTREPLRAFAGPVYTVAGATRPGPWQGDPDKLRAIDEMPEGVVALWAGGDIRGVCCFGDLLASAMKSRKVAGVVVDGGIRDTAYLRHLDLPMLVRYRTPAQAIRRWKVTAVQEPVRVRGALEDWVSVRPGDVIVADDDGAVVVPQERVPAVLERAAAWGAKDEAARADILRGMKLQEALRKHGAL